MSTPPPEPERRRDYTPRAVLDGCMDAYIATNIRSTVLEWNAAAEKMFGWSAVEAIGRSLPLLVVPERLRESLRQEWERFAQSGQSAEQSKAA